MDSTQTVLIRPEALEARQARIAQEAEAAAGAGVELELGAEAESAPASAAVASAGEEAGAAEAAQPPPKKARKKQTRADRCRRKAMREAAEAYADVAHLSAPADIIAFARERDARLAAQQEAKGSVGRKQKSRCQPKSVKRNEAAVKAAAGVTAAAPGCQQSRRGGTQVRVSTSRGSRTRRRPMPMVPIMGQFFFLSRG